MEVTKKIHRISTHPHIQKTLISQALYEPKLVRNKIYIVTRSGNDKLLKLSVIPEEMTIEIFSFVLLDLCGLSVYLL
ncbi:hypothetical protein SDC9_102924 [bioreactor metagenome]|uniref:Uncharacterized protein n=1 Tax=bioreactor metagenome TaxID=1076179 RepID=A0A645AS71_9ZZZZ